MGRGARRTVADPLDPRDDLAVFAPNMVHIASPDFSARAAVKWARGRDIPVLASVHTRFETYPRYYRMGFLEPVVEAYLRGIYRKCDALVTPPQSMVDTLHDQHMHDDVTIWSRGVDRSIFDPAKRDPEWRRGLGVAEEEVAIAFLGRLVMEKGLGMFADTMSLLRERGVPHKVLVIGDGPARAWFENAMPEAIFAGWRVSSSAGRGIAVAMRRPNNLSVSGTVRGDSVTIASTSRRRRRAPAYDLTEEVQTLAPQ